MKRNQSLDVLRGIAVLLVILYHSGPLSFGWIGVDLFFVLSGFLISGLLFRELQNEGHISIARFLFRRGMKIYPPYFVFLFTTAIFIIPLRSHLAIQSVFLQNYFESAGFPWPTVLWAHTWSLAVEEHFYFVLPFILVGLARAKKLNLIPWISAVVILISVVLRAFALHAHGIESGVQFRTHLRIDALFAGVALGYLWHYHRGLFLRCAERPLWALGLCLLAPAILNWQSQRLSLTYTTNLLAFSLILVSVVPRNLGFSRIAQVGRHSYSIYLWHILAVEPLLTKRLVVIAAKIISICAGQWLVAHPFAKGAVVVLIVALVIGVQIAAAISLGILTAKLIEFPSLKLRDRIASSAEAAAGRATVQATNP